MKSIKYEQLKNIVIILLILMNIGCVWIILKGHANIQKRFDHKGLFEEGRMEQKIGLDPQQSKEFSSLISTQKKEIFAKIRQMQSMREVILDNLDNDTFDIDKHSQKTANIQREMDQLAFKHFKDLRAICREDQYSQFDETMREIMIRSPRRKFNKE